MDELRQITIGEFHTIFADELRKMHDCGMEFRAYKWDSTWQKIFFDYDFDWSENRDKSFAVEFVSPLDRDDVWGVKILHTESTYTQDQFKAFIDFIDALKKHPFKGIVRR